MSYFEFLFYFVGLPFLFLLFLNSALHSRGKRLPVDLQAWPTLPVVGLHVVLALVYTAPWDNYLVAAKVWWYDPALVVGITLGYVPIEEYLFFIGQTLLVGTALLAFARLVPPTALPFQSRHRLRLWSAAFSLALSLTGLFLLGLGPAKGSYLGLELAWGAFPIAIQLAFGADIIWHFRRQVFWTLIPATLFLSGADALAIMAGTWTISPLKSSGVTLGGILPLEEFLFFLFTSAMVVFGITLMISRPSHQRAIWVHVVGRKAR